jgi:hypothetical protein
MNVTELNIETLLSAQAQIQMVSLPQRITQFMQCKDQETMLHYFCDWVDEYYVSLGRSLNMDGKIKQKINQNLSILLQQWKHRHTGLLKSSTKQCLFQQWKHVSFLSKTVANSSKKVQNKSLGIVFNVWR